MLKCIVAKTENMLSKNGLQLFVNDRNILKKKVWLSALIILAHLYYLMYIAIAIAHFSARCKKILAKSFVFLHIRV